MNPEERLSYDDGDQLQKCKSKGASTWLTRVGLYAHGTTIDVESFFRKEEKLLKEDLQKYLAGKEKTGKNAATFFSFGIAIIRFYH